MRGEGEHDMEKEEEQEDEELGGRRGRRGGGEAWSRLRFASDYFLL